MRFPVESVRQAVTQACCDRGMSAEHGRRIAQILVEAEMEGLSGHGLSRLSMYLQQVDAGGLNPRPLLKWDRVSPGLLILDADGAPGPVAALEAAAELAETAGRQGIAAAAVRRAGHVGPLSSYVRRLAEAGFCALAFANTPPAMAAWEGCRPLLGTNPVAVAAPHPEGPIVIDLALSVIARGKILEAARTGKEIPEGWAVDEEGRPTRDPRAALKGSLLPSGGAKGYALAVAVEILAGALAGAALSPHLPLPWEKPEVPCLPGFMLIAIQKSPFPMADALLRELTESIESSGGRVPGRRRDRLSAENETEGLAISASLQADLRQAGVILPAGGES